MTSGRFLVHHDSTSRLGDGTAVLQCVVFVAAGLVAAAVCQFVPCRDPVEVVGLPLVTGYSERAEQMGFYAFFVAAIVGAILLRPLITRLTHPAWSAFGTLSLLGLVAWCRDVNLLPLVLLGGCGSYFSGAIAAQLICRPISSWLVWFGGLIAWLFGSPELRGLIGSSQLSMANVAGLFASFVVLAASRRGIRQMAYLRSGFLAVTLLVVVSGSWLAPFDELQLALCGAVCLILGAKVRKEVHPILMESMQASAWLEFVGFMALLVTMIFWLPGRWQEAVPRMLAGAGAALSCVALLKESCFKVMCEVFAARVARSGDRPQQLSQVSDLGRVNFQLPFSFRVDPLLLAVMAVALPLVLVRPWFGVLMVGMVAWLWTLRQSQRPHARHLWLVLLMSLAFLPTSLRAGIVLDEYHDGYTLSCLWEFENGRALYSELFPLRSFEFYAGLLGRIVLPTTVEGYLFSLALLKFLPVAGVTLLSLVWTRSPHWSFAAGLLCATLSRLDPRQGMQVLLVAVQLGLLISPRVRLGWTALSCGVAACVGFDAFVTLVAATSVTAFLVPSLRERCGLSISLAELSQRLRMAVTHLAAATLPFTVVIGLWQGAESALSYWQLLFDYSRHFNVAIGIPVSWTSPEQRFDIISNLLLLSLLATTTVFRWTSLSPRRQRAWCFLTVAYFFALHRGLGRSDEFHLGDSVYLTFALGAVGVFEVVRAAGRQRLASAWWKWRSLALLVGVLAAWSTKHATRGPFDLVRYCSSLSSEEKFPLPRDEFIAQMVGPNETFWAIEQSLAHVANQRHGPTRHPLAHCIGSPSEQRRAVADMLRNPPRLVLWPASIVAREQWSLQLPVGWEPQQRFTAGLPTADVMIGVDSVPSPLRYFIISQHVLNHYRPAERPGYLVPAEPGFRGFTVIPADLNGPLRCGRLPLTWGERRLPSLGQRIEHSVELPSGWQYRGSIDPREINYLSITVSAHAMNSRESSAAGLTIRFASSDVRDSPSEATLFLKADGNMHSYLVPIGCSPAWTWRTVIGSLELIASPGYVLKTPRVTTLRINDYEERPAGISANQELP